MRAGQGLPGVSWRGPRPRPRPRAPPRCSAGRGLGQGPHQDHGVFRRGQAPLYHWPPDVSRVRCPTSRSHAPAGPGACPVPRPRCALPPAGRRLHGRRGLPSSPPEPELCFLRTPGPPGPPGTCRGRSRGRHRGAGQGAQTQPLTGPRAASAPAPSTGAPWAPASAARASGCRARPRG